MNDIRIRPARPDEMAAIVAVDDDACALHAGVGLVFPHGSAHPYAQAEVAGWTRSVEQGLAEVAVPADDVPIGIAIYAWVDGEPYLDQLSVRCAWMGRGVGRRLLRASMAWAARAGGARLWLTTYRHVDWNRPFYEREGFRVCDEDRCGPGLREKLRLERAALPRPEERIAMVRSIGPAEVTPPGSPPSA